MGRQFSNSSRLTWPEYQGCSQDLHTFRSRCAWALSSELRQAGIEPAAVDCNAHSLRRSRSRLEQSDQRSQSLCQRPDLHQRCHRSYHRQSLATDHRVHRTYPQNQAYSAVSDKVSDNYGRICVLFFLVSLQCLKLPRLSDASEGIIALEEALGRSGLFLREAGIESEEAHR